MPILVNTAEEVLTLEQRVTALEGIRDEQSHTIVLLAGRLASVEQALADPPPILAAGS
ncbi:MAG TPA: hypothetical protein VHU81_06395 [Thermoanaerobaculia bacterium]|jgi:hypothetical protein|nr:hypothetical protein [Thermoanaerobaculia bacterium]